jgi:hypothetical protein
LTSSNAYDLPTQATICHEDWQQQFDRSDANGAKTRSIQGGMIATLRPVTFQNFDIAEVAIRTAISYRRK